MFFPALFLPVVRLGLFFIFLFPSHGCPRYFMFSNGKGCCFLPHRLYIARGVPFGRGNQQSFLLLEGVISQQSRGQFSGWFGLVVGFVEFRD